MNRNAVVTRFLAFFCALALFGASVNPLYASMLGTGALISAEQAGGDRERLLGMLERDEVRGQLQAMGVSADLAAERVARMTDAEVRMLNERLDELPAGAGVLGVLVFLFLLFVITDALGVTDIFPFVKAQ
nr:DUF6627 family protein [Thioalkalivibrio sp.]